MDELDQLRALAIDLARDAGDLLLTYAKQRAQGDDLGVDTKTSATDPVSIADRAAETFITDTLTTTRPDDGILGEEGASRAGSTGKRWVVDPLDGTVNFLYGYPLWGVSIACEDADGPLVAAVSHPERGEIFHAARGRGAQVAAGDNTRALACTSVGDLSATLVATGFGYDAKVRQVQGRDTADLVPKARDVRRGGSAALDLAWVAAGRVDAYIETGVQPWDWAAGHLLVLEAGGVVSTTQRAIAGKDLTCVIAGGRAAHDHLRSWVGTR